MLILVIGGDISSFLMTEREIFKELCENDFSFYVEQFLKVLEPETKFEWNWHMDLLCHHCEKVYYGEISNLDINIPPRSLKTAIVSILFPTWIWTKKPSFKILSASATSTLSTLINIKRREIIESDEWQSLWPLQLKDYSNKTTKFENLYNGFMQAASVGGSIIGQGADLIISDDLLNVLDAYSRAKREYANNWFSMALFNRVQNKKTAKRINIMQRLHANDLSGHIAKNHNFDTLIIQMEKTNQSLGSIKYNDPRKEGEFLQSSRYSEKEKQDEIGGLGFSGYSSQMQQSPVPIGGGIVKTEWLRYYDYNNLPQTFDHIIISADLSFKGGYMNDYVCFQLWGKKGNVKYLLDIVRGKWSYKLTKDHFKAFCLKHPTAGIKWIEDKANGPALVDDLRTEITGLQGWPHHTKKNLKDLDKVQRLHLVSQEYENGLVYLPKGVNLVDLFVEELTSFTENGSATGNDDMVDTSTMALIELKQSSDFFFAG